MKIPNPNLRPLKKRVLFQFEEDFVNIRDQDQKSSMRGFQEKTKSGLIVVNSPQRNAEQARWGVVIKKGPECSDEIKVGGRIFIEKLMWSNGSTFENQEYWLTDEDHVLCVDNSAVKN